MDWNYFAQLDSNNICNIVTQTTGTIVGPNIVPISADDFVFGKRWTGSTWEEVPPPEPPVE